MAIVIRPATAFDAPVLQEIERQAGGRFREVGMADVADDEPPSLELLAYYETAGRSWVALDDEGRPIGYVLVDEIDKNAHIEQISVRPDAQGAGVGRALIDQVRSWALRSGMRAITLTTFRHVTWNAPLYQHVGFRPLDDDEIGPELEAVVAAETEHGLDRVSRVCMRLDLQGETDGLR
jgi:GNAT superfamily N-acetyltransferase